MGQHPPTEHTSLIRILQYKLLNLFKPGARGQKMCVPGFSKLLWFVHWYVCVSVCPPARALITSGMIWCDIGCVRLVKQLSWLFPDFNYFIIMTLAVNRMDGCGHINIERSECLPKKTKVMQY